MRTNTFQMFQMLHRLELRELKQAVKDFGGEIHFGLDYVGEDGSGTERPIIAVNRSHGEGPEDVYVNACRVNDNDELEILAATKEWEDTFVLRHDEIEFGHVSFITDLIPSKEDKGEPSNIKTAEFRTLSGEYVLIETDKSHWYYYLSDNEPRLSGIYETDTDRPCTIIDFDGCNSLPYAVRDALKRLGYVIELHS